MEETSQVAPETPPYTPATDIISDDEPTHNDVDPLITQPSDNEGYEGDDGEDTYHSDKDDDKDDDDISHSDSDHYTYHSDKDDDKDDEKDHDTKTQDIVAAEREPVRANGPIRCNEFSRRLAIRVAYERSLGPDVHNIPRQTLDFYESWANTTTTIIHYPDEYGMFDSDDDNAYDYNDYVYDNNNYNDTKDAYDSDSSDKDDDENDPNPNTKDDFDKEPPNKSLPDIRAILGEHDRSTEDADTGRRLRLRHHYVKVQSRLFTGHDPNPEGHSDEYYEHWAWDRTQCNGTDYSQVQPDYRFDPDYDTEYDPTQRDNYEDSDYDPPYDMDPDYVPIH